MKTVHITKQVKKVTLWVAIAACAALTSSAAPGQSGVSGSSKASTAAPSSPTTSTVRGSNTESTQRGRASTSLSETVRSPDVKAPSTPATRVRENSIKGNVFESKVASEMTTGARKPTWSRSGATLVPGTTKSGEKINTRPDLTRHRTDGTPNGFTEVKNRNVVSYTRQVKGEVAAALEIKRPLNMIVNDRTHVTKPCYEAVRSTGGKIIRYNEPTGTWSRYSQRPARKAPRFRPAR